MCGTVAFFATLARIMCQKRCFSVKLKNDLCGYAACQIGVVRTAVILVFLILFRKEFF